MWCNTCHYGSEKAREGKCPQCRLGTINLDDRPFPEKPEGKGSGKPNGKTGISRTINRMKHGQSRAGRPRRKQHEGKRV